MSNTKHTPGPWVETDSNDRNYCNAIRNSEGVLIAVCNDAKPLLSDEVAANAKLIAAAPELFQALQELWHYTKGHKNLVGFIKFEHLRQQAEDAITKATT